MGEERYESQPEKVNHFSVVNVLLLSTKFESSSLLNIHFLRLFLSAHEVGLATAVFTNPNGFQCCQIQTFIYSDDVRLLLCTMPAGTFDNAVCFTPETHHNKCSCSDGVEKH